METAVYSDFEARKGKAQKKREVGIVGPEGSKEAKETTTSGAEEFAVTGLGAVVESTLPAVVVASAGEPVVQRLPNEEIRELEVVRIPANPRLVMASHEEDGRKQVVKVFVGVNRNFRLRMRLSAQRGATENAPWKLVGRRPRLPGRW